MRPREFMALFGAAAVWPLGAHAQQPAKIRLIGYLDYGGGISPSGGFAPFHDVYRRTPFLEGLRDRGWVEGQTVTIERRFAAGQAAQLPALAAELFAARMTVAKWHIEARVSACGRSAITECGRPYPDQNGSAGHRQKRLNAGDVTPTNTAPAEALTSEKCHFQTHAPQQISRSLHRAGEQNG
jgi:hypothetical protein